MKPLPPPPNPLAAVKVRGVSLSAVDWAALDLLAAELAHLYRTRATTSAAIRYLISLDQKQPGRVQRLPVDGQQRDFAFFRTGGSPSGEEEFRRLDLQSGAVKTVIRKAHHGGALVHDKVQPPKPKRKR